jgi:ADP-heptose:LPS heptosyltransferase
MNILLVRPDGIGDEILSLPVATELRRAMPGARVTFLSSVYAAPVLAHHPDLDEVLTVTGQEPLGALIQLYRRDVDAALFLKPFRRHMTAAWLARVPLRIGTGYRWYSLLLNRRVYEHRSDFSRHESAYNCGLLRGLGLALGEVSRPRLVVTAEEQDWARKFLGATSARRVLVHPGGFSSRAWKPAHFRDLVVSLARDGHEVLLTGSAAERDKLQSDAPIRGWPEGIRDLTGQLTLRQLMAVIAESHAVVSMSTGPMHIAAALGVPTISIFDPRRSQSPTRWRPTGAGVVLHPKVPTCEKCIYEACPYWDCLDRITVAAVNQHITRVLAGAMPVQAVAI